MTRAEIVRALASGNLFQPATVLWRAFEIEAVRKFVRFEGRVLDLGCGDGTLSRVVFRQAPVRLVGVEPEPKDAERAEQSGRYECVHRTAGHSIGEPTAAFDMVFSNSVLEHIRKIEPVLAEASRLLRPGGQLVFTVPSESFHACLATTWFRFVAERRGESEAEAIDRRLAHHRYWSPEEWKRALAPVNLVVTEYHRYLPAAAVRAWQHLSNATGGLAFELFGGRTAPRTLQQRSGLAALEELVPARIASSIVEAVLRRSLALRPQVRNELSGGLLVVAERRHAV